MYQVMFKYITGKSVFIVNASNSKDAMEIARKYLRANIWDKNISTSCSKLNVIPRIITYHTFDTFHKGEE